ncbi:TetR/AcrR family transcriptional regulator [Sphingopyxis sp.]|uniref:TetR/AcrR family transcriptional regulator n=1 Tax=Sphingopyxis sp. TaxID=1908224 RepID=UPI00257CD0EF|nr:TetR/AcrR family transcriptional regulator [Sphingopyxis sp.]
MSIAPKTNLGRPADLAKREAILVAARDAFFEHGYGAAAIEQIAAAAGVSKVTVYNHFSDKQGLFTAAIERECERMRSHFSIEGDGTTSLRDRLLHIGHAMVAFLSRPEMVQFERRIAAETERNPEIGLAFLNAGPRRMKATMATFLTAISQSGALAIPDPALAAEQFAAMCKGFGDVELRFGAPPSAQSTQRRVEAAVDAFLKIYGGGR